MIKKFEKYDNVDPFGEEDWDEKDLDLDFTCPGLRIFHYEGDSIENMKFNCNVREYSDYLMTKNNDEFGVKIKENPQFYAGIGIGLNIAKQTGILKKKLGIV